KTVSFTQAPNAAANLPQYVSFATTYTNARFVDLKINSSFEGALTTNSIVGFDEIRLTAVPEPSTWAYLAAGIATVMALHRRRKA
ncbi:MAG: PEP-CTERM sorting domain-containing protein, partial [Chthoniobacterales bacterium]